MSNNPLQKYFRQPKIFIQLPSMGVYYDHGMVDGDIQRIPVYGMTGMDEILAKTPDALLTGESTVRIIASCCPAITDPWSLSSLDLEVVLVAIRIATYGESITISKKCDSCNTENDYDINLSQVIDYFKTVKYDFNIKYKDLTIVLRPLTYKQSTDFAIKNFQLQQKFKQVSVVEDPSTQQGLLSGLYAEISSLQKEIYTFGIDCIENTDNKVTDKTFIKEFLDNCDKEVFDSIREKFNENNKKSSMQPVTVVCSNCNTSQEVTVSLDQSDFFEKA
jgi:hypothetical protein